MASINEKLNYINETKSLIKDKLNNLGSEIEDETTFREYAEKIEDLYDEWPKINDEDTNITLNNTKKAKMNLQLKGNTNQNGNPTTDNPINIDVVTGENTIQIIGKNILPITLEKIKTLNINGIWDNNTFTRNGVAFTINDDLSITVNGTPTANTYLDLTDAITLKPDTYTFSGTPEGGSSTTYRMQLVGETSRYVNAEPNTWTLTETTTYTKARIFTAKDQVIENKIFKPMLEIKDEASIYEPYKIDIYNINLGDIELCKLSDYQDYFYKENNKWYKYKNIDKIIFNGSEDNWTMPDAISPYYRYRYVNNATPGAFSFSNMFIKISITDSNTNIGFNITSTTELRVRESQMRTLENWKTFLSNNNLIIYYILTTPTVEEITDTTLITQLNTLEQAISYNNQTNISQTNDNLPFIISASALLKNSN